MVRFARLIAAVLCFPFVWSLCRTFYDSFFLASGTSKGWFPSDAVALFLGMSAFLLVRMIASDPVRLYVLGHELTHALWGLAFGARVSRLKVGAKGGSVQLTKSNVWITLAPYFFPFWTMLVVALALAVRGVMHFTHPGAPLPMPWAWTFMVGFTLVPAPVLHDTLADADAAGRRGIWPCVLLDAHTCLQPGGGDPLDCMHDGRVACGRRRVPRVKCG